MKAGSTIVSQTKREMG